jgi:hypothetical protein
MKKIAALVLAFALCVNAADTLWQKITVKDTAVTSQTQYVPVPAPVSVKKENRTMQYVLGGTIIALGTVAEIVSLSGACRKGSDGLFGLVAETPYGEKALRGHVFNITISLTAILTGVAIMIHK